MTKSSEYRPRVYRELMGNKRWKSFHACHLETDLWIAVSTERYSSSVKSFTNSRILLYRGILEQHISKYPEFLSSLRPLDLVTGSHPLVKDMYESTLLSGTGPMSSVAGVFAEYICNDLISEYGFGEVVVENGGDIFMKLSQSSTISVFAGDSPLSDRIGLVIDPHDTPISVCCSSSTVGHSLSFGKADACVIACRSGALADAYATACCNAVKDISMIQDITEQFMNKPGILSVIIIKDDKVGVGGRLEVTVL